MASLIDAQRKGTYSSSTAPEFIEMVMWSLTSTVLIVASPFRCHPQYWRQRCEFYHLPLLWVVVVVVVLLVIPRPSSPAPYHSLLGCLLLAACCLLACLYAYP